MTNESFLESCRRELGRLRRLADGALAQMSDDVFFRIPAPGSNSAAIIVKHLAGNMRSRWSDVFNSDGEAAGRDRDQEFKIAGEDTREALGQAWREGWEALFRALGSLDDADLGRVVHIRREPHTVRQAIQRQLVHHAYHVGQIVFVARLSTGDAWQTLSIPWGQSAAANARPGRYLSGG